MRNRRIVFHLESAVEQWRLAEAEIVRLQEWKNGAMQMLAEWDEVWVAAGRPGPLGGSKAANTLEWVKAHA